MLKIKTVTIIGANGTMGSNVGAIFASFGNARVYMVARDIEKAKKAVEKAALSVRAETIKTRLIPKTYENIEGCIKESDWIFESVAESFDIKKDINELVGKYAKENVIYSTGTSGLSVNDLCNTLPDGLKKRYLGIHFFNPPYSLTLCEIIPSKCISTKLVEDINKYLTDVLKRNTIVVNDKSGFLGNRIGFQFINKALQYADCYKEMGGIDYIDAILGPFTGRAMAPLMTADFVGLDIHKAIVDNIYNNTNDYARDTFIFPAYAEKLVNEGKFGKKVNEGLYKTIVDENNEKQRYVYDIKTDNYRPVNKYNLPFVDQLISCLKKGNYAEFSKIILNDKSEAAEICLKFLVGYALYALIISKEVASNIIDCDTAMAMGFNWAPPTSIITMLGGSANFTKLSKKYYKNVELKKIDLNIVNDKIDFRSYYKANR